MTDCYYVTELGEKINITPNFYGYIDVHYKNIIKLVISSGVKSVVCYRNKISSIEFPEGVKFIDCERNPRLKSITLPESAKNIISNLMDGLEGQNKKEMDMQIYQSDYIWL